MRNRIDRMITGVGGNRLLAAVAVLCFAAVPFAGAQEQYRPLYHLDQPGDPSGCIRYQGVYHLFTWDHFVSSDLIHWTPSGWPMQYGPDGVGYWTGSVVVDAQATSGWGSPASPAMIAVYTAHDNGDSKEDIRLSVSTDDQNFLYYGGNPVLSTSDTLFRDPQVFWDTQTERWIMVVARSAAKAVQFYGSSDLKNWQFLSEFGPAGGREQIWEVPGLAQLPVEGLATKKWVLFCGMGPNTEQFYVGDFDGTTFIPDASTQAFLQEGSGLDGDVFADFEAGDYAACGWTVAGDAFGTVPGQGGVTGQPVSGYLGQHLASSYVDGDWHVSSSLTSPTFTITKNCINFLLGGGNHPGQTCINLLVNDLVVLSATGQDSDIMKWVGWDVEAWKGQTAKIQIVDTYSGFWGRIYVDHILFSNVLMNFGREHANWIDWGSDLYGARVFHDYDGAAGYPVWMGWMGNWTYATNAPTPWHGGGPQCLPRNLQLQARPGGYSIVQQPLPALKLLRGAQVTVGPRHVQDAMFLNEFYPSTNAYELEAVFNLHAPDLNVGLNLCAGNATGEFQKLILGYDAATSTVYLDRRFSGNVSFHPAFANVTTAPLTTPEDSIKFHVFIDVSTVEVFVNDGKCVMTSIFFPDPGNRAIELFSANGPATLRSLKAWPMSAR